MRRAAWLLAIVACGDGAGAAADAGTQPADQGATPDAAPPSCDLILGVEGSSSPRIPGDEITLSVVDAGSGRDYSVAWEVSLGTLSSKMGPSVLWAIPADAALHVAEYTDNRVTASSPGCDDDILPWTTIVDWPEGMRTLVIENPSVEGSTGVAAAYADLRGVPGGNVCSIPYADRDLVAEADFDAWHTALMDCLEAAGEHVHYVVPVYGVPYRVQGRISSADALGGVTSLDALLAFGSGADNTYDVADNPYYREGDSVTGKYDDWVPIGEFRQNEYDDDYFLVARIDGADADAALALVDRAEEADALTGNCKSPEGVVYVDGRMGLPHPAQGDFGSYEWGEWNIIGVENVFAGGPYDVVADYNDAEFGTAPAPPEAPDALYYAGWYSFSNYNDVFTWAPGAIGGHLDSCSACDIRGERDWSAMALRRGITATFGAVNEPYVAGMPEYDQFFRYLVTGASYGEAAYSSTVLGAWMMVWIGDPLYRPHQPCTGK